MGIDCPICFVCFTDWLAKDADSSAYSGVQFRNPPEHNYPVVAFVMALGRTRESAGDWGRSQVAVLAGQNTKGVLKVTPSMCHDAWPPSFGQVCNPVGASGRTGESLGDIGRSVYCQLMRVRGFQKCRWQC